MIHYPLTSLMYRNFSSTRKSGESGQTSSLATKAWEPVFRLPRARTWRSSTCIKK